MELYLIRHAESGNNALPTYRRVEDPPITAVGGLQADHLAAWLETLSADVFITSPFLRTLQTAKAVLERVRWDLRIWHNVYERGGCFRGYKPGEISGRPGLGRSGILRQLSPHESRCRLDETIREEGWHENTEQETDDQAIRRTREVCERLVSELDDNSVVVLLIHADLKRLMLDHLLGTNINVQLLGNTRNTSVTRLNYSGGDWQLDYFNSVSHLPAKLITGNEH
ncbi:MAG: histidine phosphatase family protein [Planctomycetota bacterium]